MQAIQSLSETAGAGNRLSPSGLHETGDERFDGCGFSAATGRSVWTS